MKQGLQFLFTCPLPLQATSQPPHYYRDPRPSSYLSAAISQDAAPSDRTVDDLPAWPSWGWGQIDPVSSRRQPPSVLRVRADCGGRLFTAKLGVVVHDLAHQLLNHLLADHPVLLARSFQRRSWQGFDPSLILTMLASDRSTVTPLSPTAAFKIENRRTPSPSAC